MVYSDDEDDETTRLSVEEEQRRMAFLRVAQEKYARITNDQKRLEALHDERKWAPQHSAAELLQPATSLRQRATSNMTASTATLSSLSPAGSASVLPIARPPLSPRPSSRRATVAAERQSALIELSAGQNQGDDVETVLDDGTTTKFGKLLKLVPSKSKHNINQVVHKPEKKYPPLLPTPSAQREQQDSAPSFSRDILSRKQRGSRKEERYQYDEDIEAVLDETTMSKFSNMIPTKRDRAKPPVVRHKRKKQPEPRQKGNVCAATTTGSTIPAIAQRVPSKPFSPAEDLFAYLTAGITTHTLPIVFEDVVETGGDIETVLVTTRGGRSASIKLQWEVPVADSATDRGNITSIAVKRKKVYWVGGVLTRLMEQLVKVVFGAIPSKRGLIKGK